MSDSPITNAQLQWDEEGQPVSSVFGDVYFSKANGLEETRHVFLKHNQLPERFSAVTNEAYFTIAETGFGSGLNFLAAWELWVQSAPTTAQLHFVSVEKFPLKKNDLIRALALWPELKFFADQLIEAYPNFIGKGFHRLKFLSGRINLTLIIDDAAEGFTKLLATTHPLFAHAGTKVDAWFLDGFAPSKNPQMWSEELFQCVHYLSKINTTAATFSAAAIVKQGLQNAGFSIEKVAGFGRKREMTKAVFAVESTPPLPNEFINNRSFSPYPVPWTINNASNSILEKHAIIIGGGLAGCHTARALAERGWKITLLEKCDALAQAGSGNPQGVLYAKLSAMDEAQAAFNLASLQFAQHYYQPLWKTIGDNCGVLQLAHKPVEQKLQQDLREKFIPAIDFVQFVDAQQASEIAGTRLTTSGLFFPQAGWIDPRKLCNYLISHPNIKVEYGFKVNSLIYAQNCWQVTSDANKIRCAPITILCSAKEALDFEQASHLPIKSIRGQITTFPQTPQLPNLTTVICAEGYISPAQDGFFCTGATFNLNDSNPLVNEQDHLTNLQNLHHHIAGFEAASNYPLTGRVAFRCTLPDYLPAVGALPKVEQLVTDFAPLRKNAKAGIASAGSYLPGLYINIGHGARGLAYTPLCAELLAAQIGNEPNPIPQELANALNPARFVIRDITRSKR